MRRTGAAKVLGTMVCAVGVAAIPAAPAAARDAYVLKQRDGRNTSIYTLASSGFRYDGLSPDGKGRKGGKVKPFVGIIVRYSDAHLFLLDPERKLFDSLSLVKGVARAEAEQKMLSRAQPSERLPVKPGTKPTKGQAPLKPPKAKLKALKLTRSIKGLRARAYQLTQGDVRQRLWFASELPQPPKRIRSLLKRAQDGATASPGQALGKLAGRIPLRVDIRVRKRWKTTLRTVKVSREKVTSKTLRPPAGYKERNLPPRRPPSRLSVPAFPLFLGGPISFHPDVWAFFWGSHFDERRDYVSSIIQGLENMTGDEFAQGDDEAFWKPLSQYAVFRGRFSGFDIVDENPDDSVGSWNFFDVVGFVFTHRFGSDAPNYWWLYSDHDPIFAIYVDEDEVDSSGWGGYHAFTPTEATLVPVMHAALPWFIVKVPSVSGLGQRGSSSYRSSVETATHRSAHEFVEAATDPYPFLSWVDLLKQPIWENGELADICAQGNIAPYANRTRTDEGGTSFETTVYATYWSNRDGRCMPESRPSAKLVSPANNSTHSWGADVAFVVQADDLYDGSVSDSRVRWTSDKDGFLGNGLSFFTSNLSPGTHHVTGRVTNSNKAFREVKVTVNVVVNPPIVRIDQPATNSSFAADQTINFRGFAYDFHDGDMDTKAVWSVDGTQVGTGASLFQHQIPDQGPHTVTLSATNSGGSSNSASINVNIGPPTGKPSVLITSPKNNSAFGVDEVINFSGEADAQGAATIADSSYSWSDSVDGPLGTGKTIQKALSSNGQCGGIISHHVTLTVTDSLNRVNTDAIDLTVGQVC